MNMKKTNTLKGVNSMPAGTRIVTYICLAWALIVSLLPIGWLVLSSLKKDPMARPGFQLPESICLDGYISTFKDLHVMRYFGNSLFVAGVSVVISVVMISMSAYVVARMEFKGKSLVNVLLYSTMFIPATALTYPVYNLVNRLHLYDTRAALILIYSCSGIAVSFFVIKNYYDNIPRELEEAARIDGSGEIRTFNTIALPLMKPAIAVQAIFTFVGSWNNYFIPTFILKKEKMKTIPIIIAQLRSSDYLKFDMGQVYVMIAFSIFPVIIIYLILSRHIVQGVALGSVKG